MADTLLLQNRDVLILESVKIHGASKSDGVSTKSSTVSLDREIPKHDLTVSSSFSDVMKTEAKKSNPWILLVLGTITLVCGAFQVVSSKWMNLQVVPRCGDPTNPDCSAEPFNAPFYQSWLMYISEAACILIYFGGKFWQKHTGRGFGPFDVPRSAESFAKKEAAVWWWMIPTCLDLAGSTMTNYAYLYTYASTVQVLRNFLILMTAFTQIVWLRKPLRYYEWAGSLVVTSGMIVTCIYEMQSPEDTGSGTKAYLGIILTIFGTVFTSIQLILEEFILTKYHFAVLKAVGFEGIFGIVICGLVMLICQFAGWEDEKAAFYQMGHDPQLLASQFTFFFCCVGFNGGGLGVTLMGSALLRSILFSARSIIVWMFELAAKWNVFDWYNFGGLILCFVGSLWFNNIVKFPCIPKFQHWLESEAGCCGIPLKYSESDEFGDQMEKRSLADLEPIA